MVNIVLSDDVGFGLRVGVFYHGNNHDYGHRYIQNKAQYPSEADTYAIGYLYCVLFARPGDGDQSKCIVLFACFFEPG